MLKSRLSPGRIAAVILIASLCLFLWSPVHYLSDSKYTLLLSESLLRLKGPALEGFLPHLRDPATQLPYQLHRVDEHIYQRFPPGTAVLTAPLLALLRPFGIGVLGPDQTYVEEGEEVTQTLLAALLAACVSAALFLLAQEFVGNSLGILIALAGALGSPVWSTASRSLWSQTWGLLLLSLALLLVVRAEGEGRKVAKPVCLGIILALMFVVRPTNAIAALLIGAYCLHKRLTRPVPLMAAAGLVLLVFASFSVYFLGQLLPPYFDPGRLSLLSFGEGLAGNLFSPSRGLLVYIPTIPFVVYIGARYSDYISHPGLAILMSLGIVGEIVPAALFPHWYGGDSFGPRLTMGVVPWAVVLGALAIRAQRSARGLHREAIVGCLLVGFSVFVHARGATSLDVAYWNVRPTRIEVQHDRLWDWRYPPFLAGLVSPPIGPVEYRIGERILLGSPLADPYLGEGWSWPETAFRWMDDDSADLAFLCVSTEPLVLHMKIHTLPRLRRPSGIAFNLRLNGTELGAVLLAPDKASEIRLGIPPTVFEGSGNVLQFLLPDGAEPLEDLPDGRRLGVAVHWLSFDRFPLLETGQRIELGSGEADRFLFSGFSDRESDFRWTDGPIAEVGFRVSSSRRLTLRLDMRPFLAARAAPAQRLTVELNRVPVARLDLLDPGFREHKIRIEKPFLASANILRLRLADSASPRSVGLSDDTRRLGVAIRSISLSDY